MENKFDSIKMEDLYQRYKENRLIMGIINKDLLKCCDKNVSVAMDYNKSFVERYWSETNEDG